jgi:hypothetical protein
VARVVAEAKAVGAAWIAVTRKDLVKLRTLAGLPQNVVAVDLAVRVVEGERPLLDRVLALRREVRR